MDALFKNIPVWMKKPLAFTLAVLGGFMYWALWFKSPAYWENLSSFYEFFWAAQGLGETIIGVWASFAMSMVMVIPMGYIMVGIMLWKHSIKNRVA